MKTIEEINNLIKFNREFENWDTINKAIILVAIGELRNSEKEKFKIILNDYIEISKSMFCVKFHNTQKYRLASNINHGLRNLFGIFR